MEWRLESNCNAARGGFFAQLQKMGGRKMKTKLIAITQPLIPGVSNAEEVIVYAARVSNPSNQLNMATSERLLRYCITHGHWSVFETASMTVEIQTSRAIAAQILRHRSFTFQEFSQRYSEVQKFESFELRKQAETNRQSSSEGCDDPELKLIVNRQIELAEQAYIDLLDAGVARECARMILPLCTQTTLYMTGSARSWIHYFQQRLSEHTQKEHREIAQSIFEIFQQQFPIISNAIN
jgi:thymidylate synthase (FAD)